ncbi:DUF916 domain-containing protein [Candidatus Saccharibacteria bacterium]|nr:DUF916 domain-containing protein [Candidatus Saccharibacteria bacterium]
MVKTRKLIAVTTTITALLALLVTSAGFTVSAQESQAGSGMRVEPVSTPLTINAGSSQTFTVRLTNVTSGAATYRAIVNDFVADKNELGHPALILDDDKYAPSHSLKRYVAPIQDVTVEPRKTKEVKVTVSIPQDAAGGGYFGAVRFAPTTGKQGQNITLSANVASLILVKVPGDIKENVVLETFDVRTGESESGGSSFFSSNKNLVAVARFKNEGNIHMQPFGKVLVKKGDTVIQTTEINNTDPRGSVLPESVRRFSVKLDKVASWGKYTVEGNFGYGSNGQLLSGKTSFFVLPLMLIIVGVVAIGLIVFAIFGLPRMIKQYNAKVVRRANRR